MSTDLEKKYINLEKKIEQLKKENKELELEKKLFNILVDSIPDTIYYKDDKCRFIKINKAQATALGIKRPEDAVGKTDFHFFNVEHAENAFADEKQMMRTGKMLINKEEKIKKANGEWFWVSATKAPFRDEKGNIVGIVGISRDITRFKIAQKKENKKDEYLLFITENMVDNIFTINNKGKILYTNNAIQKAFGYEKNEFEGENFSKFIPNSELPKYLLKLKDIFFGKTIKNYKTKIICKNGKTVPVEINIKATKWEDEKTGVGTIRVIS